MKLGIVMDPIGSITTYKDSSFAMLLAAQAREHKLFYMEPGDLYLRDGEARALMRGLRVQDDDNHWFDFEDELDLALTDLDAILMRKDPPFDNEYIYNTYILERAEAAGVLVVNRPQALRDFNEKVAIARFPQCCVPTLISSSAQRIRAFLAEHGDIILKPLDGMGGASIFRVRGDDPNTGVILETITEHGRATAMAQRFIPEISAGDKRILMIDGEPEPYALARIPAAGETRGNLAAGGRGVGVPLSDRDRWICEQVAPTLRENGLLFVGLDVIGDYLTEVNVTSPTCIRELEKQYQLPIAANLIEVIEKRVA